jgi:hypothetical protein
MALKYILHLSNNKVFNVSSNETIPDNTGDITYEERTATCKFAGIGWEKKSDHWYKSWGEGDYVKIGFDGNVIERVSPLDSA